MWLPTSCAALAVFTLHGDVQHKLLGCSRAMVIIHQPHELCLKLKKQMYWKEKNPQENKMAIIKIFTLCFSSTYLIVYL